MSVSPRKKPIFLHFHKSKHKHSKKSKGPYRYFRKKDPSQYRKVKGSRCYICKKKGHFAKNCPNKPAQSARLIKHLSNANLLSDSEDIESCFSEQDVYDEHTVFALKADSSSSSDEEDDPLSVPVYKVQRTLPPSSPLLLPTLSVKIQILPSKYSTPIPVIGFIDTSSQRTMLNPSILPAKHWENHTEYYRAVRI